MEKFTFLIAALIAICFNTLPVYKLFGGQSTTYISDNFTSTIITPAGFAFGIWGVIFIMFIVIGIMNVKNPSLIDNKTLSYFVGSMVAISLWIVFYQLQFPFVPTFLLLAMLFCNIKVSFGLPSKLKHFYLIYTSWTLIASIINVVILLQYDLEIKNIFGIANPIVAIVLLGVGTILFALVSYKFNSITPALVGAWAYFGIYKVSTAVQPNQDIKLGAIIYAVILVFIAGMILYKNQTEKKLITT